MIPLIAIILLIESVISQGFQSYNLTNGEPKIFPIIKAHSDLTFYVKASKNQLAITNISCISSTSPFTLIITCGHVDTNSKCMDAYNVYANFKKDGDKLMISSDYLISNNYANYVGVNLYFDSGVSNFNITITVGGQTYDITNRISNTFKNLLPSFPYAFYIPAKKPQIINVTMTIINGGENPINAAEIKEYSSREDERTTFQSRQWIKNVSPKNNELELSFFYNIYSSDTNCIAFILTPNTKISNIKIKAEVDYCYYLNSYYNLYDNFTENLSNLKSGTNYNLLFKFFYLETAKIKLSINKMSLQPFNNIYITEYEGKENAYPIKYSYEKLSSEAETTLTFCNYNYNINDNPKYINLNFTPLNNIDNLKVFLDIGGGVTDLPVYNGFSYYTSYIKSGFPFYLFMEIKQNNTANISMNIKASNPFDNVDIYEYTNKNSSIFEKNKSTKIKTENIINQLEILYKPSNKSTNYIALNITPSVTLGVLFPKYTIKQNDLL